MKLEGADEWLNISKYAKDVVLPERGVDVIVSIDKSGFIRAVELANGQPASGGPPRGVGAGREATITRLAVLKAAAEVVLAPRSDARSADVLKVAERWEAWVTR